MANGEAGQQQVHYEIQVPPEQEAGLAASFLAVWHTPHEFVLDFGAVQQVQFPPGAETTPDEAPSEVTLPVKVVSRLRVPPTVVFAILQALNANLTKFEEQFGEIRRPEEDQE